MIVLLYEKTIMIMFNHQFSSNMKNDDTVTFYDVQLFKMMVFLYGKNC